MLKKGDLCKHFKGKDLNEKNIYEILEIGVRYSGDATDTPIENLVIYKNIFQDKIFARELEDLISELPLEKQEFYGQVHRVEKLTIEEIEILKEKIKSLKVEEKIDIYDENKKKTGKTKIRGRDKLEDGEYVLAADALIINSKKEILISKRAASKQKFPLMWELNSGLVRAGESSIKGILRELEEELGLKFEEKDAIFYKTLKRVGRFKDLYLFKKDIKISEIKFLDGEAIEAKWVSIDEYMQMFNNNEIVPSNWLGKNEYEECLKIIEKNKL